MSGQKSFYSHFQTLKRFHKSQHKAQVVFVHSLGGVLAGAGAIFMFVSRLISYLPASEVCGKAQTCVRRLFRISISVIKIGTKLTARA